MAGNLNTQIQKAIDSKAAIKAAIESMGVTVGATPFDEYAGKIKLINPLSDWQTTNLVTEGHSFFGMGSTTLAMQVKSKVNVTSFYNSGITSSTVNAGEPRLTDRAAVVDSKIVPEINGLKNVLVLCVGTNELNYAGAAIENYPALKAYVQARIQAGWKLFVYTVTPSKFAAKLSYFEPERLIYNNLIRTDLALLKNVYIVDTDLYAELNDSTNTLYYLDLLHPSMGGSKVLANAFFAIAQSYSPAIKATQGTEYVVDGGFDDPSKWTLNATGLQIANSKLVFTGETVSPTGCTQTLPVGVMGKKVRITFDVSDWVSDSLKFYPGSSGSVFTATGKNGYFFTELTWNGSDSIFYIRNGAFPSAGASFKMDNLSIREIQI